MFADQTLVEVWFRICHRRCATGDVIFARTNNICIRCFAINLAAPESCLDGGGLVDVISRIDEFEKSLNHGRTVFREVDTLALGLFKGSKERDTEVGPLA